MTRIILSIALASLAFAEENVARMEQVVQSFASKQQFMGSVLVARDGQVVLSRGYGSANLEWDTPNRPNTKFRLGSVTKQFTAASILLLEERGKLSVDDPVKKHLPDAPAAWDGITIRHLLSHTSGIPNFTNFSDYNPTKATATTAAKLVARFRDKPLDFAPGEKWSYSNSGYVLLGYLIEKISGEGYADFVRKNLLEPAGMKDSGYDVNAAVMARRASGYVPGPKGPRNADYIDMTVPHAAGALYSTTEDLLKWEQSLFGGKILQPATVARMTTVVKDDYGFGLMIHKVNGHQVIEHGGGIDGFNTSLAYYPEAKLTVVVLGNLNGGAPDDIARKLASVAFGETVVLAGERKEIPVAPAVLESYVGSYEITPAFKLVITLEDGKLITQATGQPKIPIFGESETKFFPKVIDATLEFVRNADGKVDALVLHQNGRDIKGVRK